MEKLFHIFEITHELVMELICKSEDVHFHDFEEIIIATSGSLTHYVDFQEEQIQAPFISYVSMGKMHRVVPQPDLRGWVVTYQSEFIPDSNLSFYSGFVTSSAIPVPPNACLNRFTILCELIQNEYTQESPDVNTIRHLTMGLISMIESERKRNIDLPTDFKVSQQITFNSFLKILEQNFRRDEDIRFYADKMNMSERNLNLICKSNFQKSVSEVIETRKLIEAKKLLIHTDKSVSEIGFELGYNEKSYFTRVFKNKLSMTPSEFRIQARQTIT